MREISSSEARERKKLLMDAGDTSHSDLMMTGSEGGGSQVPKMMVARGTSTSSGITGTSLRATKPSKSADWEDQQYRTSQFVRFPWYTTYIQNKIPKISSMKLLVLVVLSLQNSLFTVLRRYSQGVLKETYSSYEVLLVGEIIKMAFSAYMISVGLQSKSNDASSDAGGSTDSNSDDQNNNNSTSGSPSKSPISQSGSCSSGVSSSQKRLQDRLHYLIHKSGKMVGLALIYGAMNILSFVSLRNIGAGMFTIFAQCKILTTASFSTCLLKRKYSWMKWRALLTLSLGVLLFTQPIWDNPTSLNAKNNPDANAFIGVVAVLMEVTLSGFASIYFEKVIKTDPLQLTIWERNFQLALGSFPVYLAFIAWSGGGKAGLFGGWSMVAWVVALLGAAGGLLVALSIKYGDAILKTLATTAAIILSSILDNMFLGGPLTPVMIIAGVQVIVSICNYTFDPTPTPMTDLSHKELIKDSDRPLRQHQRDEEIGLVEAQERRLMDGGGETTTAGTTAVVGVDGATAAGATSSTTTLQANNAPSSTY